VIASIAPSSSGGSSRTAHSMATTTFAARRSYRGRRRSRHCSDEPLAPMGGSCRRISVAQVSVDERRAERRPCAIVFADEPARSISIGSAEKRFQDEAPLPTSLSSQDVGDSRRRDITPIPRMTGILTGLAEIPIRTAGTTRTDRRMGRGGRHSVPPIPRWLYDSRSEDVRARDFAAREGLQAWRRRFQFRER
jgi:hypothetical protein